MLWLMPLFAAIMVICCLSLACRAAEDVSEGSEGNALPLEIAGMTVTPHVRAPGLQYASESSNELGALVHLFIRNTSPTSAGTNGQVNFNAVLFDGKEPQRQILNGDWAWHDTPNGWALEEQMLPPQAVSVWTFNTKSTNWGLGRSFPISITDWERLGRAVMPVKIAPQGVWISSLTYLSSDKNALPDTVVCYVANQAAIPVRFVSGRLYLPETHDHHRSLFKQAEFKEPRLWPSDGVIAPGEKGLIWFKGGRLPLMYGALELTMADPKDQRFSLWAHTRIKRESFDISGGWVAEPIKGFKPMTHEPFLKVLQRMHVNTAHFTSVPGYTDQTDPKGLFTLYPLKRFGKLDPKSEFDAEAMLPFVHAVEFLGEPQSEGGNSGRVPQAVLQALSPWAKSRLATTVTLSDESTWNHYAGLSDYPHFNAYRVSAPSADDWRGYTRWGDQRIGWGAPLETVGSLCRSLREISRPTPIAAWSQGPHDGWEVYDGRKRTTPTPDEIRLQAYHVLSSRITSLYWFNLSLPALVKYRDTVDELTRIGREIRVLEDFFLEGDAYGHRQVMKEGRWDWDLASIVSPRGALLFALDLDYQPDKSSRVFEFRHRREAKFSFDLPPWLRNPVDVFRMDADGMYDVAYGATARGIEITDKQNKVAVYVATADRALRQRLEQKRLSLVELENSLNFDPANKGRDFDVLKAPLESK